MRVGMQRTEVQLTREEVSVIRIALDHLHQNFKNMAVDEKQRLSREARDLLDGFRTIKDEVYRGVKE
jgi:ribosome maturation factor RimP